jgi:hypothetical protein
MRSMGVNVLLIGLDRGREVAAVEEVRRRGGTVRSANSKLRARYFGQSLTKESFRRSDNLIDQVMLPHGISEITRF